MTGSEIRKRFLEHFASREHRVLPSAPLVPKQDPTTLFISAGMQPLKPYFQGVSEPPAPRLVSCQKCFRTVDFDEVGKSDRHATFFEMLGNFAPTGAYFKETAIPLAWELVTGPFEMPKDRLRVTIHPTDDESHQIWISATDIRPEWVYRNDENWWSAGETGPCGPDSEIWWDRGIEFGCGRSDCPPDHCDRYLEFWNLVFMQYDRQADGSLPPLPRPGIDTGMGLDRITSILQGVHSIFDTDLFVPLVEFVRGAAATSSTISERLIADHIRASSFLIADGVLPTNEGRGYVLRRMIRRAQLHARRIGLKRPLADGAAIVVEVMGDHYPELAERLRLIEDSISQEVANFERTLETGLRMFESIASRHTHRIPGEDAFRLHDTFGFPLELTRELAAEREIAVDEEGFQAAMEAQRARSKSMTGQRWPDATALPKSHFDGYETLTEDATVTMIRRDGATVEEGREGDLVEIYLDRSPFYGESGGQIGDTGRLTGPGGAVRVEDTQRPAPDVIAHLGTVAVGSIRTGDSVAAEVDAERRQRIARHHSATHLLHKALREELGEGAVQRGSWVGPDHTTFDFAVSRAMTREELDRVSRRVNEQVRRALPFKATVKPYAEAVAGGAMHLFEEKYGDEVRVVCFGDWTCELCGGTHVSSSAEVGTALLLSEQSVSAGVRRIDMAVGEAADEVVGRRLRQLTELSRTLGVPPDEVGNRVEELRGQLRAAERRIQKLQDEVRSAQVQGGDGPRRLPARVPLLAQAVDAQSNDDLRAYADRFLEALGGSGVVAVVSGDSYVIKVSRDLAPGIDANKLKEAFGGRGGGRPELVQGRVTVAADQAFADLQELLKE